MHTRPAIPIHATPVPPATMPSLLPSVRLQRALNHGTHTLPLPPPSHLPPPLPSHPSSPLHPSTRATR